MPAGDNCTATLRPVDMLAFINQRMARRVRLLRSMIDPLKHQLGERMQTDRCSDRGGKEHACGIVQMVDLVAREMRILLHTGMDVFDIPPNCPIYLHGEQVKLRMIQPRDKVRITFKRMPERLVIEKLEIPSLL